MNMGHACGTSTCGSTEALDMTTSPAYYTILCYTILYYTILYYTILYYTILYYTILYYTILYYTILYYTILYYTILYYTILYYTILYYTILYYTILYYSIYGLLNSGFRRCLPPTSFKAPAMCSPWVGRLSSVLWFSVVPRNLLGSL